MTRMSTDNGRRKRGRGNPDETKIPEGDKNNLGGRSEESSEGDKNKSMYSKKPRSKPYP